jgi:2'-5' RNA ligase
MGNIRTFIAIELSPMIQNHLTIVLEQLKSCIKTGVRWVPPNNIHLSLKFIGDFPEGQIPNLKHDLSIATSHIHPFDFEISNLGAFPNLNHARVIWVGVVSNNALQDLASECDRVTHTFGISLEERPFSPHLTLGRVSSNITQQEMAEIGKVLSNKKIGILGTQQVGAVTIFKSDLGPSSAAYTPLTRLHLRQPDSL